MGQLTATLQRAELQTGLGSSYIIKDVVIHSGQRAGKSLQLEFPGASSYGRKVNPDQKEAWMGNCM